MAQGHLLFYIPWLSLSFSVCYSQFCQDFETQKIQNCTKLHPEDSQYFVPCNVSYENSQCSETPGQNIKSSDWPGVPTRLMLSTYPVPGQDTWSLNTSWQFPQDSSYKYVTGFRLEILSISYLGQDFMKKINPEDDWHCYVFHIDLSYLPNNTDNALDMEFSYDCISNLLPDYEYRLRLYSLPRGTLDKTNEIQQVFSTVIRTTTPTTVNPSTNPTFTTVESPTTTPILTTAPTTESSGATTGSLTGGKIAGVVVGVLLGVVLILVLGILSWRGKVRGMEICKRWFTQNQENVPQTSPVVEEVPEIFDSGISSISPGTNITCPNCHFMAGGGPASACSTNRQINLSNQEADEAMRYCSSCGNPSEIGGIYPGDDSVSSANVEFDEHLEDPETISISPSDSVSMKESSNDVYRV